MDNNQPTPLPQQTVQAAAPQASSAQGAAPTTLTPGAKPPAGNDKKIFIWLIGGLVVVILVVGAVYMLLGRQNKGAQEAAKATPKPVAEENLEKDLNSIDVGNADSEFTSIDQDLQNL